MEKYVVQFRWDDDDEITTSLKSSVEILNILDSSDFYPPFEMRVFESTEIGVLQELDLYGCWHDFKDPLFMKAVRPDGSIAFCGRGTDH